ncbi:hypothetical protein FACS189429_7980 [Bacteroidia bacterium]|nr:hypothetical protein FACS189429_7980 [Bacteroidia bacterium]
MIRYFIVLFRLAIAYFAFRGTVNGWSGRVPHDMIYFTTQSNIFLGIMCVWAAISTLFDAKQPPTLLKGAATLYIVITGLVANFILDLSAFNQPPVFIGINSMDMVHIVAPVLAVVDFIFFDRHKVMNIRYALQWLIYPLLYFIAVLILNFVFPKIGYPYPFINLHALTVLQLLRNVAFFTVAFYLLGLLIVAIDSILPKK